MDKRASAPANASTHVPYGPLIAVFFTIAIYMVSQVLGAMIVWLYPVFNGWDQTTANEWLSKSVYAQFFFVLAVEALTVWFLFLFLRRRKVSAGAIGLGGRPQLRDLGYGLAGFIVYFGSYLILAGILQQLIPSLNVDQKQEIGFSTSTTGVALLAVFISLVVLPPIVEEIMARGFLYSGLRSRLSVFKAALVTSSLFAAAHLQFGSGNGLLWIAAIDTFVLSLVLVYLREKTGKLWSPIFVHGLKNGIAFLTLFILRL